MTSVMMAQSKCAATARARCSKFMTPRCPCQPARPEPEPLTPDHAPMKARLPSSGSAGVLPGARGPETGLRGPARHVRLARVLVAEHLRQRGRGRERAALPGVCGPIETHSGGPTPSIEALRAPRPAGWPTSGRAAQAWWPEAADTSAASPAAIGRADPLAAEPSGRSGNATLK